MKVIKFLKSFKWAKGVERPGSILKADFATIGMDDLGYKAVVVGRDKSFIFYIDVDEFKRDLNRFYFYISSGKIGSLVDKYEKLADDVREELMSKWLNLKIGVDKDKILAYIEDLKKLYKVYSPLLVSFLPLDKAFTNYISEKFGNIVIPPSKPINLEEFKREVLEGKDIEYLLRKYLYLFTYDFQEYPTAKERFLRSIREIRERKEDKTEVRYGEFYNLLRKSKGYDKKILEVASKIVWLRTERTDILRMFIFVLSRILEKIAEIKGVKFEDLAFYTLDELKLLLLEGKSVPDRIIKKRRNGYLFVKINSKVYIILGDIKNFSKILLGENKVKKLKGLVASRGGLKEVVGEVIIVKSFEDLTDGIDGKILVTPMTTPDMEPFLSKVRAIVTDEGGITCHAAIVSRELGIPCVVGTKIATEVLKNGDLVKINLDSGVVEIIKS